MNINLSLSTESIENAIARLKVRQMHLEEDTEQLVGILTEEGAEVAQASYREWGVEAVPLTDGTEGTIMVVGDMPAIAEFGAGDETLTSGFENMPGNVYPGSYSEENAQQYSRWGFWYFGGKTYTEVPAHHGLLDAKRHIIETATETAKEVMAYD